MIEKSATAITARRALVDRIDHYTAPEDLADAVITEILEAGGLLDLRGVARLRGGVDLQLHGIQVSGSNIEEAALFWIEEVRRHRV